MHDDDVARRQRLLAALDAERARQLDQQSLALAVPRELGSTVGP